MRNLFKILILRITLFLLAFDCFGQNPDARIFLHMQKGRSPAVEKVSSVFSGSVVPVSLAVPFAIGTAGFLKKDSIRTGKALVILSSAALGFGLSQILKHVFERPRPYQTLPDVNPVKPIPDRWSMPSGHTSVAFSSATALCLEYPCWEVIAPSILWAGGVGVSRVMLGHHYPGDVLAGAALGAGSAWLTRKAGKFLNTVRSRHSGKRNISKSTQ